MELTEEEAKKRLESEDNVVNLLIKHRDVQHKTINEGRGKREGDNNIPKEIKTLMALTERGGQTQEEFGETFGVSSGVVSYLENGKINPGKSDAGLAKIAEEKKSKMAGHSLDLLSLILESVPDKIASATKLKDVTGAAKDIASVHEKLTGVQDRRDGINVLIYAPRIAKEAEFSVVEAEVISA